MTSYINKFKDKKRKITTTTTTVSLLVKDEQLFKNYNKIWEKIEGLIGKKSDRKPFYGNDDNKYIKTKIKHLKTALLQIFIIKKYLKKKYHTNVCQ